MKEYKELVRPFFSDKRMEHSVCVAKEAATLAEKYGADPEKARVAGILHDIMKETPPSKQLKMLEDFGILLTELEKSAQKLWHAILGAAYLERELGVSDPEILAAVRWHTTGRAGMSLLEQVIFVADFTSADRDYTGVERVRRAARTSLRAAMIEGLAFTITDLAQRELAIHPDTVSTYNEVILKGRNT